MTAGLFVTATGTACGKTWVTRGLTRALVRRGRTVVALKPLETGVAPGERAADAFALACAAGRPELADAPGLARWAPPLSPLAATLETGVAAPPLEALVGTVRALAQGSELCLVEGAGGLLVPLDEHLDLADLAGMLGYPVLLVGRDALGTLSHVCTALESAGRRRLAVSAVVLTSGPWSEGDPSCRTNAAILSRRLSMPVLRFPSCPDDDDALADAAEPFLGVLGLT